MKIRTSFVSNSSSSSFVLIATRVKHDEAFATLEKDEQNSLQDCFQFTKCLGQDVVIIIETSSHDGDCYVAGSNDDNVYEAFNKYRKAVGKDPNEVFSHSEDW